MSTTTPLICHFEPLDTWFFRESRPHGSVGSSELGSVFPPPVRTLLGALRTLIGDAWHERHASNWRDFAHNRELQALIGYGDDLGSLRASGPFLTLDGHRLYPAPANLMAKEADGVRHYFLLDLGNPVTCDLGSVHLPSFPAKVQGLAELVGSQPAQNCWLTESGMHKVLSGQAPAGHEVIAQKQLLHEEPRLGIGRDNNRRSVQEGLLYQTRHIRLAPGVGVELHLHGLADASLLPRQTTLRLGGEGRQAALVVPAQAPAAALPAPPALASTFVLYNLTPVACPPGLPAGIPAGFVRTTHGGADVWEGQLGQTKLRILAVACTRPLREGGWDLASHQARPVQTLLAPGSVLYVQSLSPSAPTPSDLATLADASGRGLYIAGQLPVSTTFQG